MTKQEIIENLIKQALEELESKYGNNGQKPLVYHNVEHSRDVVTAVESIAGLSLSSSKITNEDLQLLKLAASYHDIEHSLVGRAKEDESVRIVTNKMNSYSIFTGTDIEKVKNMILSTIADISEGLIIQSAGENYLEKIIADADLFSFGSKFSVFWDQSQKIYQEFQFKQFNDASIKEKNDFLYAQISILENHKYYTPEANQLYSYKKNNIEELKQLINLN